MDEALAGLVAVHPGLRLLEGHRVIIRADIGTVVKDGKVSQFCGKGLNQSIYSFSQSGLCECMLGTFVATVG